MAEAKEVRHAGIGIDLNMNGLDDFKRANSMMDDFLETMKEASRIADKFKNNFSGLGGKSSDGVRKIRDAIQDVYHSMDSAKNKTNQVTENVHKMQQEFKYTSDAAKKVKLNSGLNSDINKSAEEVKKLAKSADQSGNKFSEMFRKLRSGSSESNGSFNKLHDSAKKTFDEVHKGTHFLRDVVTASFISNAAINTWYSLKAGIGSALKAGEQYDKEQQVMHATWNTLTGSSVKGDRMVKAINSMSVSFGQSAGLVNELNQQFYHVLDKQGPTDRLTKSVLTMADTLGMGAESTKRLGLNFTHMMASSKMQLGDFNMISDQLPMFGERLLEYERKAMKNSHLTMSQLRNDMSAGKVSAKDAEAVMNGLGKKYAKASENMMKTLPGMERVMSARGAALFGALEKPFMKAKNPIFGAISKWVSDKKTETEFTRVGSAASKGLNTITKAFAKVFNPKESPHLANDVMNGIAKGVTNVSNTIAHHAKSIVEFFKSLYYTVKILKDVGIGFAKGLVSGLSAIVTPIGKLAGNSKKIHSFSDALKSVTTHKKGLEDIGKLLAGIWVTSKAMKGISFANNMVGKTTRMFIKPEIDSKTGKHELTLFSKAIRSTTRGIGKSLKWTAKIAWKGAKGAVGLLWKATKGTSKLIGKGLSWTAKIAYKGASKAFSVLGAGIKTLGKSFLGLSRMLLTNPIGLVVTAVVALGVAFYEAYKHIKPFREWVNKTAKAVVNFGKGIAKWASKAVKSVVNAFKSMGKKWNSFKSSFKKSWNKHWSAAGKTLKKGWNTSVKNTRAFFSSMGKKWDSWKSSFKKSWSKHWNNTTSNLHSSWNSSYKHTKKFFSSMGTKWAGWKKSWSSSWNKHWDKMRSNLHNYWNKDLSHTKVFGKSMGGWLSTFKDSFKNGWSSLGTGVENIFKGLWKNLKKFARDGMNDVIDLINGGINAVDSVIHTFGGKKKTIGDLSHVHFAEGTGMFSGSRNPITRPTMAMLNDGNDSPQTGNKEMVMLPNGDSGIVQGRNTKMMLPAGTEVLNASETAMLMSMQGVTKYAKGTGIFGDILNSVTSGISGVTSWVGKKVGSLEKFFKTAENIIAHPIKSLENLFSWSSKGISGVMSNIGHGLFKGVEKQAKTWWSTLWGGVSDSLDSGASSSTLVNAMEKYGATNKYVYGAEGPSAFDCSGLVEYTLKKLGISFPRTSGEQYKASKHVSNPKPGDLVFFGPGGSEHVGVYTGNGEFYSAENEKDGMGISKVLGGGYGSFAGYGRVPGLSDSTSSDKSSKSSGLLGTIKKQVGSGFWKFISKLADEFGDGGSSNPGGSGVQRWKPDVIKALKKNGFEASASQVSAWMKVIARESNGDPTVVNNWDSNAKMGIPSKGLVQTIQPTFEAYKFPGHNNPLNGYDDLLAGINYMKHIYGKGASAFARVSGPEGYAKGGHISKNKLSIVGEKGWELFNPDTSGTIIPHEASEKLISGGSKGKVTISAPTKVVIQGNADKSAIDELDSRLEKRNNDLVEKFRELWGLNDEGGLTV